MNTTKHNWILYLITTTVITTVAVQLYWNYKNYEQNKQRVLNEIQLSLDNAIEIYYAELSREQHLAIISNDSKKILENEGSKKVLKTFFKPLKKQFQKVNKARDSLKFKVTSLSFSTDDPSEFKNMSNRGFLDSILNSNEKIEKVSVVKNIANKPITLTDERGSFHIFKGKKALDSLDLISGINKILISVRNDSLNYQKVDSVLQKQLKNKNINVTYALQFFREDTLFSEHKAKNKINTTRIIEAKSTFLGRDKEFKMLFSNPSAEALKRSSTGILLSLLLSLAVISSLFYLLKVINQQKQLATIKNDLISNITHEFKTPITTVSTALEAIESFNIINNKEKTKNYVSISKNQVEKLHIMVEKLLETATLDSEKLLLKKEEVNIVSLIETLIKKHQVFASEKTISFYSSTDILLVNIDAFHIENATSNLIDNAIKYGGEIIVVSILNNEKNITIEVSDNGKGIEKSQVHKVFDKFYRVPKGNTHDVKGFGIGLYYTKKIIEKHNGTIDLTSNQHKTTFTITLPND